MTRLSKIGFKQAGIVLMAELAFSWPVSSQCLRFNVSIINPSCGGGSTPKAISPSGDLVGYYICGAGNDRAYVAWGGASLTGLNLPNQYWSRAYGINAHQHITGTAEILGTGIRAYLYQNGSAQILDVLPNHDTGEGLAVNDSDVIVGYSANTQIGPMVACRWIDNTIESLQLPETPGSQANGINDAGHIVGYVGNPPVVNLPSEAFLWINGAVTMLGKPLGASNSNANAISNTGIIVGHFTTPDPQGAGGYKPRALAWINGQMVDLGVLSGYLYSRAFGVNDDGTIVGYCNNPPSLGNGVKAFIWRNGQMRAIADLLAPQFSQYQVKYAYGINNAGQIAAVVRQPTGGETGALLTPIPPKVGDTNCDWLVNVSDLLNVINAWGPAPPQAAFQGSPDLNHDGAVNVSDLLMIINNWGG